jgi:hypothetical protein
MGDQRTCTRCHKTQPIDRFRLINKDDPEGYRHSWCIGCVAAAARERRKAIRDGTFVSTYRTGPRKSGDRPVKCKAICPICYGLPHRVRGERCERCGLARGDAP